MTLLENAERKLDPPVIPYGERDRLYAATFSNTLAEAMRGIGPYWTDSEPWPTVEAVRKAIVGVGLTDAQRWAVVCLAVAEEASKYAAAIAGETT